MSALCTGRLYPPGNIPGTHFCYRLSRIQVHGAAGKIFNDTIGNRTRDLPAGSAVFHPTAPSLAAFRDGLCSNAPFDTSGNDIAEPLRDQSKGGSGLFHVSNWDRICNLLNTHLSDIDLPVLVVVIGFHETLLQLH